MVQHSAGYYNTVQHSAGYYGMVQDIAGYYSTVQHIAGYYSIVQGSACEQEGCATLSQSATPGTAGGKTVPGKCEMSSKP